LIAKLLMALALALTAMGAPGADADVFAAGHTYVAVENDGTLSLWSETNGQAGLQMQPTIVLGHIVSPPDARLQI